MTVFSFYEFVTAGVEKEVYTTANWREFFTDSFYHTFLWKTVRVAAITAILCALMGYPPAYFIAMSHTKHKWLLLLLLIVPFWISFTIRTFSWIHILGEQGVINVLLMKTGLISEPLRMLYTEGAVIMGMIHFLLPYMILNVYVSIEGIDRNLISAARTLGCTAWQAFYEVVLPLSLPGLMAGPAALLRARGGQLRDAGDPGFHARRAVRQHHLRHDHGTAQLADGLDALARAAGHAGGGRRHLQPLHGPVAHLQGAGRMNPASENRGLGWRAVQFFTVLVYIFMFAPILVVVVLSFNDSQFGGFPMTGFSFRWYHKLMENEAVLSAFQTSVWVALITAIVCSVLGIMAALALVRYDFPGKEWVNTILVAPALVPETVLGVGLLLLMRWAHQPRTLWLLVLGHIMLALPYVVLVVQARLIGIKRVYEEAAMSLGANRFQTFREITLPLLMPAIVASLLLVFTISFDNITASMFWRPSGVETMPTQILSMLKISISPEINALGTLMIVVTVGLPLLGGGLARYLARSGR